MWRGAYGSTIARTNSLIGKTLPVRKRWEFLRLRERTTPAALSRRTQMPPPRGHSPRTVSAASTLAKTLIWSTSPTCLFGGVHVDEDGH